MSTESYMRDPELGADAAIVQIVADDVGYQDTLDLLIAACRYDWDVFGVLISEAVDDSGLSPAEVGAIWNGIDKWLGPLHLKVREGLREYRVPVVSDPVVKDGDVKGSPVGVGEQVLAPDKPVDYDVGWVGNFGEILTAWLSDTVAGWADLTWEERTAKVAEAMDTLEIQLVQPRRKVASYEIPATETVSGKPEMFDLERTDYSPSVRE